MEWMHNNSNMSITMMTKTVLLTYLGLILLQIPLTLQIQCFCFYLQCVLRVCAFSMHYTLYSFVSFTNVSGGEMNE